MKRLAAVSLTAGILFGGISSVRTDGHAVSNEGTAVILMRPANGLPRGWSWQK